MDCETMDALQNNVALTAILGNIAGDRTILSGCEPAGANRTAGYIFLHTADFPDGEVLWFEGGSAVLGFYLKKETVSVTAFDVEYPQAHIKRTLAPGVGDEHFNWDDFRRIATNAELSDKETSQDADIAALAPPPLGIVQIFAGTEDKIPANYMPCDGRNLSATEYAELYAVIGRAHTPDSVAQGLFRLPDLRGRFIAGYNADDADYNAISYKNSGGEKKHKLTPAEQGAIRFRTARGDADDTLDGEGLFALEINGVELIHGRKPSGQAWAGYGEYGALKTARLYDDAAMHENRPPYCTLLYIMRVK
jgi:microcystin-dependent protein